MVLSSRSSATIPPGALSHKYSCFRFFRNCMQSYSAVARLGSCIVRFVQPVDFQYSFEIHDAGLYFQVGNFPFQEGCGFLQFGILKLSFFLRVAFESGQTTIGSTVRVEHQDGFPGSVQSNGLANLIENKRAVAFMLRRCKGLCSARDADRVPLVDANSFEKFTEGGFKPAIKTPHYSSVSHIVFARRGKIKNSAHIAPQLLIIRGANYCS